mmetsp:Transcript_16544/g.48164  ORF Transcript_16544/g.48164 Transcript_16544/m.48164 type:complete len:212 (+) Transcript_16544:669-1304(+)
MEHGQEVDGAHARRVKRRAKVHRRNTPRPETRDSAVGMLVEAQVSDALASEVRRNRETVDRFASVASVARAEGSQRQEFVPRAHSLASTLCSSNLFIRGLGALLPKRVPGRPLNPRIFVHVITWVFRNLRSEYAACGDLIPREMRCVDFKAMHAARQSELDDTPVVAWRATPAGFPSVHDLALDAECVRIEDRRTLLEKVVRRCKPLVCGE